jgi:hypothetical protein
LPCILTVGFHGREEPSLVAEDLFKKEPRTRRRPVDVFVAITSYSPFKIM